ncbi:MAG: hypothetical protein WDA24_01240 [Tissierellales bacterium]
MKKIFKNAFFILLVLSLSLIIGCTADKNISKVEEEAMILGYVTEKTREGENNFITVHLPKSPEGQNDNLKLKAANSEDYEYLVENNFYLLSYGKDSLEIKNIQLNNQLGEAISQGEDEEKDSLERKSIPSREKMDLEDYTQLDLYKYDITGDGTEEIIGVYTTAQRDSKGEVMWDDGQNWVLVVHGADKDYELYNNYVQIGSIQFYVFTSDDTFHITTVENTTAGLKLIDYVYNKAKDSFSPEIYYDVLGNVNMLYVSNGY